jgi:glycosyltransferase involved in cell wall biosynthesis
MARHLQSRGHAVTILSTDAAGAPESDTGVRVVRARDIRSSRLLRRALGRGARIGEDPGAHLVAPTSDLLTKVLVPDALVIAWLPMALRAARSLIASQPFDCLVTTSPPETAHLVGLLLGRRRPAWVADFRDGWTFEPLRPAFPTHLQRRLDTRLERAVVESADAVVSVTEPITLDLRRRLAVDTVTVHNGYDPTLDAEAAEAKLPDLPLSRRLVVHTGSLSGLRGRDARPLFEAIRRSADDPAVRNRIAFVQAGPTSPTDRAAMHELEAAGLAVDVGMLSRADAIRLQRRADALLLLTSQDVSQATGKLFEYLAADRPIIALAAENEAARIVSATRAGIVLALGDIDGLVSALRAVALGHLRAPAGATREAFVYPGPAIAMERVVETAIARHRQANHSGRE